MNSIVGHGDGCAMFQDSITMPEPAKKSVQMEGRTTVCGEMRERSFAFIEQKPKSKSQRLETNQMCAHN